LQPAVSAGTDRRPDSPPFPTCAEQENVMPTDIERSYVEQGYELPHGLTWELVAARRARWAIRDIYVPVAVAPSCIGWGVPHIGGVPLRRP
jgi:hypothetical protein